METPASFNNRGFTLIEFLVAIVILMVGMLGLLQTVNYAIAHNTTNQLRQGALQLADEQINLEKAKPFDLISAAVSPGLVRSYPVARLVNGAYKNYSVVKTGVQEAAGTSAQIKNIDVQVSWKYKQERFVHSIASLTTKQ